MLYQKKVSLGSFLKKGEDFKNGDIIIIANEGKQVQGEYGEQNIFLIKLQDGREGNTNFNQTTINNLIDAYGENSIKWIGKEAKVWSILSNVQGKMIKVYYFLHPDTELDEATGQFIIKGKKSEDIPVIEEEEIDVNSLEL